MPGLYIHIPFCKSRCIYCNFYSTTFPGLKRKYVDALCLEMDLRKDYLPDIVHHKIDTIYLGGGTPSQLSADELEKIFHHIYNDAYSVAEDAEVTMECNPDDITEDFTDVIRHLPVNRISMGVQTFDDARLKFICRRHTSSQVVDAIDRCRKAGIGNISIDLIYGLPGETLESWESDIDKALKLNVEHISAYSLTYEEGTPLYKMLQRKEVHEADEELSLTMYNLLMDKLEAAGYEHYEISNFALPGMRSRHNSSYWNDIPYIGIGAAAHSFDLKSRQWNISDVKEYISGIKKDTVPFEREELTANMRYNDMVMTSLRTCEGVDMTWLEKEFGEKISGYCLSMAKPHIDNSLMVMQNGYLKLTRKGLFVSDDIISDLMWV